jgi:hypothetical protein
MTDDLRDELPQRTDEPFLPVETKLVTWSLVVGMLLLGLLVWVSNAFFAALSRGTPGSAGGRTILLLETDDFGRASEQIADTSTQGVRSAPQAARHPRDGGQGRALGRP